MKNNNLTELTNSEMKAIEGGFLWGAFALGFLFIAAIYVVVEYFSE